MPINLTQPGSAFEFEAGGKVTEVTPATDPFPDLADLLSVDAGYRSTVLGQAPTGYWKLDDDRRGWLANEIRRSSVGFGDSGVRAGKAGAGAGEGFGGFLWLGQTVIRVEDGQVLVHRKLFGRIFQKRQFQRSQLALGFEESHRNTMSLDRLEC